MNGRGLLVTLLLLPCACGARTDLETREREPERSSCIGVEMIAVELPALSEPMATRPWDVHVVNPGERPAHVIAERWVGGAITVVEEIDVMPGALGTFTFERLLPTSRARCDPRAPSPCEGLPGESCVCDDVCTCRTPALDPLERSARAIHLRSTEPVMMVQLNPGAGEGTTHSADSSELLPRASWDRVYSIVSWPQTLGPPDYGPAAAFLTVVSAEPARVRIDLGPLVGTVESDRFGPLEPGDAIEVDLGELETLDLWTTEEGGDLTGSRVEADVPIAVFTGVEAGDAPTTEPRRCCADHLETQLLPDRLLGTYYEVPVPPNRSAMINDAAGDELVLAAADPLYLKIAALSDRSADVSGLPDGPARLAAGEAIVVATERPLTLRASAPVAVLAVTGSQLAAGIPRDLPGGDPSLAMLPPTPLTETYWPYVPPGLAFDYVVFTAPRGHSVRLDGAPAAERCSVDDGPELTQYTCPISSPRIRADLVVDPGMQGDGLHEVELDAVSSMLVVSYDAFLSYIYPACAVSPPP